MIGMRVLFVVVIRDIVPPGLHETQSHLGLVATQQRPAKLLAPVDGEPRTANLNPRIEGMHRINTLLRDFRHEKYRILDATAL